MMLRVETQVVQIGAVHAVPPYISMGNYYVIWRFRVRAVNQCGDPVSPSEGSLNV